LPRLPATPEETDRRLSGFSGVLADLNRSGHIDPRLDRREMRTPEPAAPPKRGAGTTRCAMFSLILKRAPASHLSSD
jgi:hypothetical protein